MTKQIFDKKPVYCYVVSGIFLCFSILMTIMSVFSGWDVWVTVYVPILAVIMLLLTFHKKVSGKLHGYFWVLAGLGNLFIYGYQQQDLYGILLVINAFAIVTLVYRNPKLLALILILSMGIIYTHIEILHTVQLEAPADIVQFIVRVATLLFAEGFLVYFTGYINRIEEGMKTSIMEARSAEHSKSDFLANMSHEIRTPMNAIVGMCELILRDTDISESTRDNCFNIQSSGRSLLSIINDILDFSKIESGKLEIIEGEFNIASTLNDVINMAVTRKGNKNIEIIVKADPNIPIGLYGDEIRIKQVMINLMTNAVKFTEKGAVILHVSCSKQKYGVNLKVEVEDSGIGITEENLEKLFTSFQQVDTKKNRSVEGTGLGLAISKRLIESMNGFMNVTSEYGVGSVFSFVIPLRVSNPEPYIHVNNADKISVLCCLDLRRFATPVVEERYKELMNDIRNQLNIRFTMCGSVDYMKQLIDEGGADITHCFVNKETYITEKEYLTSISDRIQPVVIQDIENAAQVHPPFKCMYKPFYSMSVAAVLNNENITATLGERRSASITFSAPKARVLIVDDNAVNLKVAVGLMRPYHMQYITVESGPAAIQMLHSKDIDLVLMDHMMPEMDGVETTRIIRSMEGDYFKKLPIIALTANAVNGVREMFISEGFNDFVAKPIEVTSLDKVLKSWLPKELICAPTNENSNNDTRSIQQKLLDDDGLISETKGLSYTGGDTEAYYEILDIYTKKGEEKLQYISELYSNANWKNYIIEVHALKSSSLGIGCSSLSELANQLEMAGKAQDYGTIHKHNAEMLGLYAKVISEGKSKLAANGFNDKAHEAEETEIRAITVREAADYLNKIRCACQNYDSDEISANADFVTNCTCGDIVLTDYVKNIKAFAEDFEYDEAIAELEKLTEALGLEAE